MIQIRLNGKDFSLEEESSISVLLEQLKIKAEHIAVARNFEVILKRDFTSTIIIQGDEIEIIRPTAGG